MSAVSSFHWQQSVPAVAQTPETPESADVEMLMTIFRFRQTFSLLGQDAEMLLELCKPVIGKLVSGSSGQVAEVLVPKPARPSEELPGHP